jgi:hypothetical protein
MLPTYLFTFPIFLIFLIVTRMNDRFCDDRWLIDRAIRGKGRFSRELAV